MSDIAGEGGDIGLSDGGLGLLVITGTGSGLVDMAWVRS